MTNSAATRITVKARATKAMKERIVFIVLDLSDVCLPEHTKLKVNVCFGSASAVVVAIGLA